MFADNTGFAYVRTRDTAASACGSSAGRSVLIAVNRDTRARVLLIPVAGSVLAGCHVLTGALGDVPSGPDPTFSEQIVRVALPAFGFAAYTLR